MFNTPILFLTFNRLDTTKRVFSKIAKAQPPRIYLASDGAREAIAGEAKKVQSVRDYLLANIDWQCEIKTLFREKNFGCKYAVSGAIDWFFEHEEMGIILEDDCLPDQSFFPYCEELLERYKNNDEIYLISGDGRFSPKSRNQSYHFIGYSLIWGWATWRRVWKEFSPDVSNWKCDLNSLSHDKLSSQMREYFQYIFKRVNTGKINSWAFPFTLHLLKNNGIGIVPTVNLISNIGFGEEATHTSDISSSEANIPLKELAFPLKHPSPSIDTKIDKVIEERIYRKPTILMRAFYKLRNILRTIK